VGADAAAHVVAEITPLPPGITGELAVEDFEVHPHGDVAVAVYDADERVHYFGQDLTARYRITDVWRRTGAGWRLIATQVHAVLFDPPAVALPPEQLDDYVGTYRLTDAVSYVIRRDGAALIGQRTGRDPQPLSIELRDVMFVAGQPRSRKVFRRGADGRITGFVDRREGVDIRWDRVP
jgi:hypothetical protein